MAGIPSGVTLVPQPAIGSPWLFSPNFTAAHAFICHENTFLSFMILLNFVGNTNTSQAAAMGTSSIITYILGTCSDGSQLPPFLSTTRDLDIPYCLGMGYPSGYDHQNPRNYNALSMSKLAQGFSYRQGPTIICPHVLIQSCWLPSYTCRQVLF